MGADHSFPDSDHLFNRLNLTGRITLCKLFAYQFSDSLVLAITLKVCCTILVDAVYTQSEVFHNRFFAFLNFVDLKNKFAVCYGWLLFSFGRFPFCGI